VTRRPRRRVATTVIKRSIVIRGQKTSVSLESVFWNGFKDIVGGDKRTLSSVAAEIDETREGNLSSAIRVFVLERLTAKMADTAAGQASV
jgi:predicted DNA-binding ribbon-helix-helix protein